MEESERSRSLAVRYRPKAFAEVIGQPAIISILSRQIETHSFKNTYLFCGPSGCGKTTCARIMANEINGHEGEPIEIDAASNNGVDNIRQLIVDAQQTAIDTTYKVYIIDECVSGDTEVLTENGFKRFDSLDRTEKIAQYKLDGSIEFVKPYEYIEKDYIGDMYNVRIGNKANFIMSPNHVQPLYYHKSKLVKEKYIKDVRFAQTNSLIRSGFGCGSKQYLSVLDKIVIALQADGTLQSSYTDYNYWTIQLKKERKKIRFLELLQNSGLEYKVLKPSRSGCVRYSVKTPINITKLLSSYFKLSEMSGDYAREFIYEVAKWDGYVYKAGYLSYGCTNKENADFCQSVGVLGGFMSRIALKVDDRSETFNDYYVVYFQEKETSANNNSVTKSKFLYSGKIYCVKVPSHMIIIRKDGYEMVTGNCHMLTTPAWNAALKLIEEPPSNAIFIFCTTNPNKIPETILTRVQRFDFKRVSIEEITDRLEFILNEENFKDYDRDALRKIAYKANGFVREAVSLLDKCKEQPITIDNISATLGFVKDEILFDLLKNIIDKNTTQALDVVKRLKLNESNLLTIVDNLLGFIIDCAKVQKTHQSTYGGISGNYENYLVNLKEDLIPFVDRVFKYRQLCDGTNADVILDMIVLELCGR